MRASQRSTITLYWYNVQIVRDHRCVLSSLIVVTPVWNVFIFFLFQIQSCIGPCGPLCPPASHSVPLYIPVSSVSHCVPLCPTVSPVPPCPTANLCHKSCQNLHLPLTSLLFTVNLIFFTHLLQKRPWFTARERSQGFPQPTKVFFFGCSIKG